MHPSDGGGSGAPSTADRLVQLDHLYRLKAHLSQVPPTVAAYSEVLRRSGIPCTLPLITKLVSKYNKRGQWRCGLALCCALPAIGLEVDAQMANAALGSCARGGDADSAWELYRLMSERNIALGTISFRALLAALGKGGRWLRCLQVFMHAVEAGVPLEASSIMVTIVTLDRAGRWALAEAVFTTTMLFIIDASALLEMPLLEASPPLGATAAAAGRAPHISADAAGEPGGHPAQHADHGAAERRWDSAPAAREALPEGTGTVGMLVAPPGPGLHAPRPDEDEVAAALLRAMLALRWRVLSHGDAGMSRSALLGLLQADAETLGPGDVDSAGNAHPAGIYGAAAERGPAVAEGRQADVSTPVAAKALRSLKALRKDALVRACCHALLLAYQRAPAPPLARADVLIACMRRAAEAVRPDIVCYNITIAMHASAGDLRRGLRTLLDADAAGLDKTVATFAPLLQAAARQADFDAVQVAEHLVNVMHASNVQPDQACLEALSATAALIQAVPHAPGPPAGAAPPPGAR